MAEEVKIKVTADTKQADSALSQLNKSWVGLNAGISLAKQAAQALGEAYKFLAGDTMEYAAQVRQMMRVSGQNAEMTSRMIQLTDDFALSEGSLEAAMKGAAQKGIAFTVDSLAELSDEYLALEDPIARNTFLVETFGRAGLEMAKVMERGSQAIKEQGAAQADNLIMTQANLDAAEELRIAEDNLNDSFQGIKYTLGNAVIPELVKAANAFELLVTWHAKLQSAVKQNSQAMVDAQLPYKDYLNNMIENARLMGYVVKATADGVHVYRQVGPVLKEVDNNLGILTRSEYAVAQSSDELAASAANAKEQIQGVGEEAIDAANKLRGELAAAMGEAQAAASSWIQGAGGDIAGELEKADLSAGQMNQALIALDGAMGTNTYNAKLQADATSKIVSEYQRTGDVDAFKESLLRLKNGGFIPLLGDVKTARAEVQNLYADLRLLDGTFTAHVVLDIPGDPGGGGGVKKVKHAGGGYEPEADGGLVWGGESYLVGERGPEIFTPTDTGHITPNGEIGLGGMTINNLYVTLPGVTNARQFADALGTMANNARNSGRAFQGG